MLYISYLVLAALVVIFSIYLSKYVDALDKKTDLSGAFIGGVLLAAVTSLPELFTSLTAVLVVHQPQLVQGNVYGSNIFNLTIFAVCILFASKIYKDAPVSKGHKWTVLFTIALFIAALLGMEFTYVLPVPFLKISWATVAIIAIYVLNLKTINSDDITENENEDTVDLTVKQIVVRFVLLAVALVAVSILLTKVTDKLADELQLGKTVAGAIFLGIATSLPELTASINLVRLKNFNASIGNVTGSNLFNFTILCFGDIIYTGDGIFSKSGESQIIILCAIASSVFALIALFSKKSRIVSSVMGALMIGAYVASIALSI